MTTPISSLADLESFATSFVEATPSGAIVLLKGEMGIGKTTFVRTVANALYPGLRVTSPSFTVRSQYLQPRILEHFDFYRFEQLSETDLWNLGYFEALENANETSGYVFLEWPEKVTDPSALNATVEIQWTWIKTLDRSVALRFFSPT